MGEPTKQDQQPHTIRIPEPDPGQPRTPEEFAEFYSNMTPEERADYWEKQREAAQRGHDQINEKFVKLSKTLTDTFFASSQIAIDNLRDYLEELSKRITARTITQADLTKLTDILRDAGAFGADQGDSDQLSLFKDDDRKLEESAVLEALPHLLQLKDGFVPMLNGAPTNDLMTISTRYIKPDMAGNATVTTGDRSEITIEKFTELQGGLSTSAKKILDTSLAFLTALNYYRSNPAQLTLSVEIPLIEYGEANGYQLTPRTMDTPEEQEAEQRRINDRIKELKKSVKRDLTDLSNIAWSGTVSNGKNKGDYRFMRIISSHSIRKGIIEVNFDVKAAEYFVKSYVMQYPIALLKHDNRKPNSYVIGRKLAFHNSNDNNHAAGTDCTLSVKSLLAAAAEIPTIEEIKSRNQRNWKDKIKKPLETALNENIAVGLLTAWEYRDPRTGTTYTTEKAQALTWAQYEKLMVDFIIANAPDQAERRAANEAKKQKAKAAATEPKAPKKRGRPRKEKAQ